jgi:ATP-binding protein involved in chromosome partitioning
LNFLGEVPLVQSIREGGDSGVPAVLDDNAVSKNSFMDLAGNVVRQLAIRNAQQSKTKIVEIKN